MHEICRCNCEKDAADCVQCGKNLGYAIGRFFNDAKVIDASKIGTKSSDGKYCYIGKSEVENGGVCDILGMTDKMDVDMSKFVPELQLRNGIKGNMSDYLKEWIESSGGNNGNTGEQTLAKLEEYEQGKMFISPFKVGATIVPFDKEAWATYDSKNKIKAVKLTLTEDSQKNLRQSIQITTNVEVNGKHVFSPQEFIENFSISGSTTKNSSKYIRITDGGIVRPVCLKYSNCKILIDNVYVYVDSGTKTVPIGAWGAKVMQNSSLLQQFLDRPDGKILSDAIEHLGRLRKFIAPYWCAKSHVVTVEG